MVFRCFSLLSFFQAALPLKPLIPSIHSPTKLRLLHFPTAITPFRHLAPRSNRSRQIFIPTSTQKVSWIVGWLVQLLFDLIRMLPLISRSSNLDDVPQMPTPFSAIRHASDSLRFSRCSHPTSTPHQHQDRTSGPSISNIFIHQTRTSRNGTHRPQLIPTAPNWDHFHSSYLFRQPRSPLMQMKCKQEGRRLHRNHGRIRFR